MTIIGCACKLVASPNTAVQSCILAKASPINLQTIVQHNLMALRNMITYCNTHAIKMFRISSDIIPFASHPSVTYNWQQEFANQLAELGNHIRQSGVRVSMHPGQYTVLNSPSEGVVTRAIADLQYHTDFLNALGLDNTAKLILHVGGVYGNKVEALQRFEKNFARLPALIQSRLTLENDEKCFAAAEVLPLAQNCGIPMVLDTLHHAINPAFTHSVNYWIEQASSTWKPLDGMQKIHYSQQLLQGKSGAHSHTIAPKEFVRFYTDLANSNIAIMLEVKDKDISARKCNTLVSSHKLTASLQAAWAFYKYAVLEKSHAHYLQIRQLLSSGSRPTQNTAIQFYALCDEALALPHNPKQALNALQHVWGYFKDIATATQKARYEKYATQVANGTVSNATVKKFLLQLAQQENQVYILHGLYCYLP